MLRAERRLLGVSPRLLLAPLPQLRQHPRSLPIASLRRGPKGLQERLVSGHAPRAHAARLCS